MSLRHLLDAVGDPDNVRPSVGVHVRIAAVGVIQVFGGRRLPSQMPSANEQQPAKREPEKLRFQLEQTSSPHPGEQNDPMVKTQQAPRRLVGDQRVNNSHQNRVQRDKTKQQGIAPLERSANREPEADQRQHKDDPLAEHRPVGKLVKGKQPKIVMPRMLVQACLARPVKIRRIGEDRIRDPLGITEKRGKKRQRHRHRRQQHHRTVRRPDPFEVTDPLPSPPPGTKHHQQRGTHRA